MKIEKLMLGLVAAAALTACSSTKLDEPAPVENKTPTQATTPTAPTTDNAGQRPVQTVDLGPAPPRAIELRVGDSCIILDAAGITIKGLNVQIEGELSAQLKGGVKTAVSGDGLTVIQGGLTTIN